MDKDIILKLNSLKAVKPESQWKAENRNILFNQISNSSASSVESEFEFILSIPRQVLRFISQPAWAVFFIALIALSVFSVSAAKYTKPGDSLYIAKRISERAQLAITFNKEKKTKLDIKFASDHAKGITQVLSNIESDNEEKVERLTRDFKREVNIVREKLNEVKTDEEMQVFTTSLGKGNKGMQISNLDDEELGIIEEGIEEEKSLEPAPAEEAAKEEASATSTLQEGPPIRRAGGQAEQGTEESIGTLLSDIEEVHKKLGEAEALFDENDYDGTFEKLEEVDELIENTDIFEDQGEVKGVSESATSTVED